MIRTDGMHRDISTFFLPPLQAKAKAKGIDDYFLQLLLLWLLMTKSIDR